VVSLGSPQKENLEKNFELEKVIFENWTGQVQTEPEINVKIYRFTDFWGKI
jgi:hypothetical protein